MSGHVRDSVVADGDFLKTGDSGVVSVGRLPAEAPYDGSHPGAEYPLNVTIERCHFGQTGVYGKQTSCYFAALVANITLRDNLNSGNTANIKSNGIATGSGAKRCLLAHALRAATGPPAARRTLPWGHRPSSRPTSGPTPTAATTRAPPSSRRLQPPLQLGDLSL